MCWSFAAPVCQGSTTWRDPGEPLGWLGGWERSYLSRGGEGRGPLVPAGSSSGTKNSPFLPRPYQTLCPLVSLRAILRLLDTSRCGWCNSKCQILAPGPLLSSGPRPQLLSIQPPTECSQEKGAQAQGCLNPGRVGRCFEIVEAVQSDQELPAPSEALDTHF